MPRPEKVQAVADIKKRLEGAEAVFLTEFRGLSVKDVQELRKSLRESGADYKVVKMTLARLAVGEAGIEGLDEYLVGPTALAFAKRDPVTTAKALKDFSKTHDVFVLKAGLLSGTILTPEQVSKLAEIDSREVLLAKIAGATKAPLYAAAGMFASFSRGAATMFDQLLTKKKSGEFVAQFKRQCQRARSVADGGFGPEGPERNYLSDVVTTVVIDAVLDHFFTAVVGKVHVDVGDEAVLVLLFRQVLDLLERIRRGNHVLSIPSFPFIFIRPPIRFGAG